MAVAVTARVSYNNNINKSATEAQEMVSRGAIPPPQLNHPNVIVTVGDAETSSEDLAKVIGTNGAKVQSSVDKDFYTNSDIESFSRNLPPQPKGRVMGIIDGMAKSYEFAMNKSLKAGRDPEAVRLAAQLYVLGNSTYGGNATEHPAISIVGYRQGGETAKRALDILDSMQKTGSTSNVNGRFVNNQIHLVTLGTPELNFGGDKVDPKNPRTDLWSEGDLWGRTPFKGKNPESFSGTNGSSVDYLSVDAATKIAQKLNATLAQRRKARKQP